MVEDAQQGSAALDVARYRTVFAVDSIINILPKDLVEQMIAGFFHVRKIGIAFLYVRFDPRHNTFLIEDRIDPFDISSGEIPQHYNKVCSEYYLATKGEFVKRPECDRCDKAETIDTALHNITKPRDYLCWMGFREHAYPLVVAGKVRAVILAGQFIPQRKEGSDEKDGNDKKDGIDEIERRIQEAKIPSALKGKLLGLLGDEAERQRCGKVPSEAETLSHLDVFHKTLQKVLDSLYNAEESAATNSLLKDTANYLAERNPSSEDEWWLDCMVLLRAMCSICGIKSITPYERRAARYVAKPERFVDGEPKKAHIPSRYVLSLAKKSCLAPLDLSTEAGRDCLKRLDTAGSLPLIYRHDTHSQGEVHSTLLSLVGSKGLSATKLLEDFAYTVSTRMAIAGLIFRLRKVRDNYQIAVGSVAHSFRTPLQILQADVEKLREVVNEKTQAEFHARLKRASDHLFDAKVDLDYLLGTLRDPNVVFDFVEEVSKKMNKLEPIAEKHPCRLVIQGGWPSEARVYGKRRRIRIALGNLIENAIKYSWRGKHTDGEYTPHEVRVGIEIRDGMVHCHISNYGIGIPPETLQALRAGEPGIRAKVEDRGKREGTGWGFPVALSVADEHSGLLDIASHPADDQPRFSEEKYHRYVTEVVFSLPTYES